MTKRTRTPAVRARQEIADQWRCLVGPGHQFPTLNERVLGYWDARRIDR